MSLRQLAVSGVRWTSYSSAIATLLQIIQVAILARFLSPDDFGLMAVAMVVIGFAQAFIGMGISNAIIHKQDVTHRQLSSLYWINILAGIIMYSIIYFLSSWIADFYHEKRLDSIIQTISIIFLITPFGQQYFVFLEKELAFKSLAKINIMSKFFTLMITSFLAYRGFGVYALVYGVIFSAIFTTIRYIMIGYKQYIPSFVFSIKEIGYFLKFGLYQMGEMTVNYFNYQFDTILIGKLLGVENLGIYTIAKELIMKPATIINPVITRVAFPTMSKVQDDISKLKEIYLKMINFVASINFPIYLLIMILAPELVYILFGDRWDKAIGLVEILAIFGAIRSVSNPIGSLLLARGRADLGFWWNFGLFFYVPLSIYIYSFWGLKGIAWGLVANMIILQIPGYFILVKPLCQAGLREYFLQILKPALLTLIIFVFLILINIYEVVAVNEYIKVVVVTIFVSIATYFLNILYNKEFVKEIKGVIFR